VKNHLQTLKAQDGVKNQPPILKAQDGERLVIFNQKLPLLLLME
jgi:hypothetical protein